MSDAPDGRVPILIIEDDRDALEQISQIIADLGYVPLPASSGETGLGTLAGRRPPVVLLDVCLPGMDGIGVLQEIKRRAPETAVIMTSGHENVGTVVKAMKLGASDFLTKPVGSQEIGLVLAAVWKRQPPRATAATPRNRIFRSHTAPADAGWVGGSFLERLRGLIARIADTNITILLTGETGVGKGTVARLIHAESTRRNRAFIKVNCAALPAPLLESELFGYERGAFTGAVRRKPGKFELAHGGTLLLDEVADLPLGLQAKLLHVLQDGEYTRVGGEQGIKVDARIIAAANRDLETAVRSGTFRPDLYYRLNVVRIQIPPLRERQEEIPALARHFWERYARLYRKNPLPLSQATLTRFAQYAWPGNIRELENIIKRMVILESEAFLLAAPPVSMENSPGDRGASPQTKQGMDASLKEASRRAAREAERELIRGALEATRWNRMAAARRLHISYKALLYKMRACGL